MNNEKILLSQFTWEELEEMFTQVVKKELQNYSKKVPEEDNELLTRSETAKLLGISLTTLHDFTQRGIIPAYRMNTRVRYKKTEVLDSLLSVKSIKYERK